MWLAGNVTNRDSTILAGGTLLVTGGSLQNVSTEGQAVTHFSGTQSYYDYDGWKSCAAPGGCYKISSSPYHPAPVTTTFGLPTTRVVENAASASGARGRADGAELAWTNSRVEAGETVTLQSGGDTTLHGAVVEGRQVSAEVGGDLTLESLQDTRTYSVRGRL